MSTRVHFPGDEREWDAFRQATANAVDGPCRGAVCCTHCCLVGETRHALLKRADLARLVALRRRVQGGRDAD